MNKKSIKYLILPFIIAIIPACENEVDSVKLPAFEQKLAITSFISPSDSISYIFVRSNRRVFGELGIDSFTGNLSGTISDGSNEVELDTTSNGLMFDREKMQIQYGKTYTLKVSSDIGLAAEALCTVPEKREFYLQLDTFSILHQNPGYSPVQEFRINISFTDVPGEINYYRLAGQGVFYRKDPGGTISELYYYPIRFEKDYYTDADANADLRIQSLAGINLSFNYYDSAFLKIYLLNTEKSYYMYHTSLGNYNSDENPFSEVTPVYSNIKGGLGIFTSYTSDSLIYRLK